MTGLPPGFSTSGDVGLDRRYRWAKASLEAGESPEACEILRQTVARAGGAMASTVMVGDAGPDIGVARRASVPVIGVTFGYTEVPIAELKPDLLIGHMRELPGAVETLMATQKSI